MANNPKLAEVRVATQFGPGNPGGNSNPAKRAAGAAAWRALLADFEENGVDAILAMREANPTAYVQLVASGLPAEKALDLTVRKVESLMEEQARMMAESYLESKRRSAAGPVGADPVHDSVPTGLPTG